jgi:hypothetical protein
VIALPTLAEVVNDPDLVETLPATVCGALLIEAGVVTSRLGARIALAPVVASSTTPEDRALTIEEAAQRLRISPATMQRWLRKPPYDAAVVVRSRTCVRVSAQRLDDILLHGGARLRRKAVSV